MKKALLLITVLLLAGCTSSNEARRVLAQDGFTNIKTTGYRPFKCSDSDSFQTGFEADKNGKHITGTVCSGLLKGATIRYD
jgi:hypothetical protein